MKRVLFAGAAALALASTHPAHALFGVGDIVFDPTLEAEQRISNLKSAASWVQQARDMVQQYRMLENQSPAIAHLPQQAMNLGRNLATTPSLQNPLPQANTLTGILDGSRTDGRASEFLARNRYYDPQGDDFTARELRARAQGTAGLQALAQQGVESIEARMASLREFFDGSSGRRSTSAVTGSERGCLDQSPADDTRRLDPRDRLPRPIERAQHGLLDQRAGAVIGGRDALHRHDSFGKRPRRHRRWRVAQHVIDQPQAFARAKPGAARPLLPRADLIGPDVRIEQLHCCIEMDQTGAVLGQLLLQAVHHPGEFRALVAQSADHMRLGHRGSFPTPTAEMVEAHSILANKTTVAGAT